MDSPLQNLAQVIQTRETAWSYVLRWVGLGTDFVLMGQSTYLCKGVTGSKVFETNSIGCAVTPPHGPGHVSVPITKVKAFKRPQIYL